MEEELEQMKTGDSWMVKDVLRWMKEGAVGAVPGDVYKSLRERIYLPAAIV